MEAAAGPRAGGAAATAAPAGGDPNPERDAANVEGGAGPKASEKGGKDAWQRRWQMACMEAAAGAAAAAAPAGGALHPERGNGAGVEGEGFEKPPGAAQTGVEGQRQLALVQERAEVEMPLRLQQDARQTAPEALPAVGAARLS